MSWLMDYSRAASQTDVLSVGRSHIRLLAAGLFGEAGSVVAEVKKKARERHSYPTYEHRVEEELGDLLWYFTRVAVTLDRSIIATLPTGRHRGSKARGARSAGREIAAALDLACSVGRLVDAITHDTAAAESHILETWDAVRVLADAIRVDLRSIARRNLEKTASRWPRVRAYSRLFDERFPIEEQLPRRLRISFHERTINGKSVTTLRCNGLNFGDRLTDNSDEPDFYRYHDVFHFAYACHLGWSPVVRALLRCKRKSRPRVDEVQDGARAGILEEAVAATVFARAKKMHLFDGVDHVDFDLLKTIQEFVRDYEVGQVPLWQWEAAILNGFEVFRRLSHERGGVVTLDLRRRRLRYSEHTTRSRRARRHGAASE